MDFEIIQKKRGSKHIISLKSVYKHWTKLLWRSLLNILWAQVLSANSLPIIKFWFAFSWRLALLNSFSYTCWPFVGLFWGKKFPKSFALVSNQGIWVLGHLASSVGKARNSQSQGCEFKRQIGHTNYLNGKEKKKKTTLRANIPYCLKDKVIWAFLVLRM